MNIIFETPTHKIESVGLPHVIDYLSLKQIKITGVSGSIVHNSDFTDITCYELENLIVIGELEEPDQMFRMPVMRSDGKETIFIVNLVDGKFEAILNFPTSGEYSYTNEQANAKFSTPIFNVKPVSITVARRTSI